MEYIDRYIYEFSTFWLIIAAVLIGLIINLKKQKDETD